MSHSRREFLRRSGRAAAVAPLVPWVQPSSHPRWLAGGGALPASLPETTAPSDTLVVGLIGCRSMGFGNLANLLRQPGVVCGGLCDVDAAILERRIADVEEMTGARPRTYRDYRELLDEPDLDAVVIGTPDHWHCLQTVDACEAGKDVYVEKPLANSIAECDAMVAAARRTGRIVQVGQQQRSGRHWQDVVALVRSGDLGVVRRVNVWGYFNYGRGAARVPDEEPPPEVDFDLWLGPAPMQPFNPSRFHSVWRHQWDFGGGLLTDWGVHLLDVVLWAMDVEVPPLSVSAAGGIYVYTDRALETPDTLSVVYDLGDFTLTWEHGAGIETGPYERNYGIAFVGENGTLVVNRQGWEVRPVERDGVPLMEPVRFSDGGEDHFRHAVDFVEAVRLRRDPVCTIEMGRSAALYAHLGNIAFRTASRVVWNDADGRFAGNAEADRLIRPVYREPWSFPG